MSLLLPACVRRVLLPVAAVAVGIVLSGAAQSDPVTFHEQVAPVVFRHCAPCHRPGQSAPFPLLNFADAKKHARDLADVTARRFMPPWLPAAGHGEFIGERRLTESEIAVFARWHAAGAPEGDAAKAPPAPVFSTEWQLGQPDLVIRMPAAYTVPAGGRDVYRHFILPLTMTNRRWVRAWEFRPNSRAVHHAFLRLDRSGEARRHDAQDPEPGFPGMDTPNSVESPNGHFASWQPGAVPRQNPPGLPWALEPGADVVMQMHLQPLGKPEPLQAELGFYFTEDPPTNRPVKLSLINYDVDLAPGVTNAVYRDELTLPADADLLGLLPHTHYLGRRVEGLAILPDGVEKSLLLIPDWDFNWQGDYTFRQPVFLPAGTRLVLRVTFDNSTANLRNPANPPVRVQFGLNTTDEMAELWLQLLPRTTNGLAAFSRTNLERTVRDVRSFNLQRLRINAKDAAAMVNLGKAALSQGQRAEAQTQFLRAVETQPELDDAHYFLGLIHRMENNPGAAAREFARTLELNPGHVRAHGNLGLMHLEYNRLERAAEHFAKAVTLDPTDAIAHGMLGTIRLQQGRWAQAERLLARAAELDPSDAEVRKKLETARQRLKAGQ